MAGEPLKRALQDVGYDLHPDPARRTAVGDDEALRFVANLVHDLDVMGDRITRRPREERARDGRCRAKG